MARLRQGGAFLLLLAALAWVPVSGAPPGVSTAQRTAVLGFLQAVAGGDPQAVAQTLHPDDLRALRLRVLRLLESERGDGAVRSRLFGQGMPLDEIEHLTDVGFYATLSHKLRLRGREYASVEGLAVVPGKGDRVHVVVSGRQPKDHGKVHVVNVVTLRPYGKDWKAAIPDEIEAQIEDLIDGRPPAFGDDSGGNSGGNGGGGNGGGGNGGGGVGGAGIASATAAILELVTAAEKSLNDGRCADYYGSQMSPNFRKVTAKSALQALIKSCQESMGTRQLLLSTLHIVRGLEPHYEAGGHRAMYDLAGQGLPYQTFSVEEVDRRWYIAE